MKMLKIFLFGTGQNSKGFKTLQNEAVPSATTSAGAPIGFKTASLTAGPRGPILLQDHVLVDETAHFDRERIPERVVHAKGAGDCYLVSLLKILSIMFDIGLQVLLVTLK